MNIRDFEYLIAIDELKSFVKASKKCFISQPALSQQVKKIEEQLGIEIFERNKKSIITTLQGRQVIKHAKEIISSYVNIKSIGNKEAAIRIALIPTICSYLLPHIVENLNKELPNIKFYFLELKTDDLIKKLKAGEIDVGVIAHFSNLIDDKLSYSKLYEEEFLLTLPKSSNLVEADFPRIITDKKLILLEEGNCISDNIKDICAIHDQNSFNDFYATNIETVKNMIRVNNGVGLLPKLACQDSDNLKTISFRSKKFREVGLVTRQSYHHKEVIQKINKIINDSLKGKI